MSKEKILQLLRSSRTGFVSGADLASRLGISRTMVWKHIKTLEHEGFGIEAVPSQGYRITLTPDLLRQADIKQGLKTRTIGKDIRLFAEVVSTNTLAMEAASQGAAEGTVIIAETQTGGKGRLGRQWISPQGNLYLSVILRPNIPTHKAPLITLVGAVAVASAIRKHCSVPAAIKWPNDILISGKKVAGLLTEMSAEPDRIRHIALGIGIDVNMELQELPQDVRMHTTTLANEAGAKIDRKALVQQLLQDLEHWYRIFLTSEAEVLKEWEQLNMTIGCRVTVSGMGEIFEGLAQGIDQEGRLKVALDDNTIRIVAAGDVTILKR
ncbi:MAG: biotin--[acetyl-CoA-carboxylase] ligase [Nitrospirae bacterium GWC2_56_14]|nr:MAG: biotin--[acetyl-CoA-carboxylase] ligase [Nitrospirae bacterium GWC2_56_14]